MKMIEFKDNDILEFPKYIGCGLAGGDFQSYQKVLNEFIESLDEDITVYIVSLQ